MMEVQTAMPPTARSAGSNRDMRESQRALELRNPSCGLGGELAKKTLSSHRFFAPNSPANTSNERDLNGSLNNDGALDAYAETIVWRLNGVHAMVSLIDRGTQYFLAGCLRPSGKEGRILTADQWFKSLGENTLTELTGCSVVPTPGGLCENTLSIDRTGEKYPCFVVNDLSQDPRFACLPVVDGTVASYRFYAGTPITTDNGVSIGSFFLFDDKPRPQGLHLHEKQFIHQQAANVMKHLETKREATERRRVALMSQGIAKFLERDAEEPDEQALPPPATQDLPFKHLPPGRGRKSEPCNAKLVDSSSVDSSSKPDKVEQKDGGSIIDKIRLTLDQAANILRESLELTAGGVVFLDTAAGYTEIETDAYADKDTEIGATVNEFVKHERRLNASDQDFSPEENDAFAKKLSRRTTRRASDRYKASKVLAKSTAGSVTWDSDSHILDTKTLQTLVASYPKGNMWYIDDEGYFSSLEQVDKMGLSKSASPSGRRASVDITQQRAEANMLSRIFHKARQIIFLPLWDAGGDRWYSGCFVWSQSAVPVFTIDSEVSYLSAFTNSLMVEISRLDALTANKMKSDFISSISHEFRSPLHGILASAEFLRESEPDATQLELISTIQNCGGQLLDTINHVLDYSKINSFEKSGNKQGTISNELYQMTNLALLCEDIVNGMIAANEYRGTSDKTNVTTQPQNKDRSKRLEVILDIEHKNWEYNVQPGALQRVVMNIFGNAQKYTDAGQILVQLRILHTPDLDSETVSLRIRDSGRGMSTQYMERKLYHPFAQEDTFAPGVGLGLSIVWSIVNQLGGKISIRSELGKGTDVEITLPVKRTEQTVSTSRHSDLTKVSRDCKECILEICRRSAGKSVSFSRTKAGLSPQHDATWDCIKRYCAEWYGFEITSSGGTILISDSDIGSDVLDNSRVLVVHDQLVPPTKQEAKSRTRALESICHPIGPFRLARCLLALLNRDLIDIRLNGEEHISHRADNSTQTPLGSPEERAVLDGIIATDYGFHSRIPVPVPLPATAEMDDSQAAKTTYNLPGLTSSAEQCSNDLGVAMITLKLPPSRNSTPSVQAKTTTISATTTSIPIRPKPKSTKPAPPTTSLHILAVDDNDLNLQLIQRFLKKRKSDIIATARNGIEAVEAVKKAGPADKFDIIFMDISMPEMNGFEATRLIRAYERSLNPRHRFLSEESQDDINEKENENASRSANCMGSLTGDEKTEGVENGEWDGKRAYIVALTGLASRRDRDEADDSGFDDFLTKPISFAKIGELLKKLSKEKEEEEEACEKEGR
ncbi:related to nik-1 protein (Os-1p protein) [Rhynchosporium graminicola]|uniref:Related to nik-1 protein (Os-1p protein) n=1 Tax=Rhynchosporium graminicola TaxID=2792576 RepID=A0A1E1KCQ5_9HELO|nr:related to nik-1 protein (Os-1p protein) [Rhynchosporium commune]